MQMLRLGTYGLRDSYAPVFSFEVVVFKNASSLSSAYLMSL